MKLLLVDDEVFSVEALQNAIDWQDLGIHKIYACYDAEDAKDILNDETIDLMITDIEMPSGSGLELLKWIDDNKIPVVSMLLSCHPDFAYAQDAIRYKAFAYLLKPFQIQEICDTVRKAQAEVLRIRTEADRDRQLKRLLGNQNIIHNGQNILKEQFWHQLVVGGFSGCSYEYILQEAQWRDIHFPENQTYLPILFVTLSDPSVTSAPSPFMGGQQTNTLIKGLINKIFSTDPALPPVMTIRRGQNLLLLPFHTYSDEELDRLCANVLHTCFADYQTKVSYLVGSYSDYSKLFDQTNDLSNRSEKRLTSYSTADAREPGPIEKSLLLIKATPNISREELAQQVGLNADYFSKLFKKEVGKSLNDYISDIKIEEAQYLLTQTAHSISSIASMLDYANFSYFSRIFRKKTGLTPSEYKKKYYNA